MSSGDRHNFLPAAVLLLAILPAIIHLTPSLQPALQLDFTAVRAGQFYRVFTGHLTHWSTSHFLWDTVVFLVVGTIAEHRDRRAFLAALFLGAVAISLAMMRFSPELGTYRGLSGIDSALFALAVVQTAQAGSRAMKILATFAFVAMTLKLAFESLGGRTIFVDSTAGRFTPVPLAHLVGAAVGLTVGVVRPIIGRVLRPIANPCFPLIGT